MDIESIRASTFPTTFRKSQGGRKYLNMEKYRMSGCVGKHIGLC